MQRSLTILSYVAAPLTLFITSKLVIPNVHERSCIGLRVVRNISQRISAHHCACNALLTFNLEALPLGIGNRWQKDLLLINGTGRERRRKKHVLPCEIYPVRISCIHARCSRLRFPRSLFFLLPARFRSRPAYISGEISWKICRAGFIRCRSSRLTRSCPVVRFLMIATVFFVFCREAKSALDRFDLVGLFCEKKKWRHRCPLTMIDTFFDILLRNKIPAVPFRSSKPVSLDKNGMTLVVSKGTFYNSCPF